MPQYVSKGGTRWYSPKAIFDRWNSLPYGKWTTASGRVILFNRFYEPILERDSTGSIITPDPREWVKDIKSEIFFYDDAGTEKSRKAAASAALVSFHRGEN